MSQQGETAQTSTATYAQANRDAGSLQVRLETASIKNKISDFLKGKVINYQIDYETKTLKAITEKLGKAKVNDSGYQAIMSYVESIVNHSTVMGNFGESHELYDFLRRSRKVFVKDLWINMHKYGLQSDEFQGVTNNIFSLIEPFMTRTIGDGERATIRDTTIQRDSVITDNRKSTGMRPLKGMFG